MSAKEIRETRKERGWRKSQCQGSNTVDFSAIRGVDDPVSVSADQERGEKTEKESLGYEKDIIDHNHYFCRRDIDMTRQ